MANKTKKVKTKSTDKNLALIAVILGAASFFNTIFTGIPAIILGIVALRRNAGDRTQAKLGILFGILGSLLIIPIVWLAIHFLRVPFEQQTSVPPEDRKKIMEIAKALREYRRSNDAFPLCGQTDTASSCADWRHFTSLHPGLVDYPMSFEREPFTVEDRPEGTLVYVNHAACFISVPTAPGYIDEDDKRKDPDRFAALVYYHANGRACFNVHED